TFSNYGVTSVFESTDGGGSFVSKEGDLPDMPVRWALYNPINLSQVLLATEVGVWSTEDIRVANPHWVASNSGLANVRVDMMKVRGSDNLVIASTHGRGMYSTSAFEFLRAEKILPDDGQMHDNFGHSVCISGIYAIIGSAGSDGIAENSGAAYIFSRIGSNEWDQSQKLVPLQPGEGDNFGCSVSINGDYAVIGAMYDEEKGIDAGAAYIFQNQSGSWIQKQKLLASDGNVNHRFGAFVSIYGDYTVIGAPGSDGNESESGAAYIFKKDGENWVENKKIIAFEGHQNDAFGVVTINGNHIAVGAPNHAFGGYPRSGAVYMFELIADEWQPREMLSHDAALEGDKFGWSVSIDNDLMIVGAFAENSGQVESGAAYIYEKNGDFWDEVKKLSPSNPQEYLSFGRSVSIFDTYAVVGASGDWINGLGSGSAYVYQERNNDWFRQNKIVPQDGQANDFFGSSVHIYNDIVLIGASGDDDNGDLSGSAYTFTNFTNVNNQGILFVSTTQLTIPESGGIYNLSVFNNGTGLMDWVSSVDEDWITIIEGTYGTNFGNIKVSIDPNQCCERNTELRVLAPNALDSPQFISIVQEAGIDTNEFKILGDHQNNYGHFGWSVAIDGNTAVVGAEGDSSLGFNAGAVYVFEREGCDWIQKAKLTVTNQSAYFRLGISVDICGDNIIAGTWEKLKAYIFEKPESGWQDMTETSILTQTEPMGTFGYSVAISANSAIVGVGAPSVNRAYVYDKPEGGWADMTETMLLKLTDRTDFFGYTVDITDEYAVVGEPGGENLQGVHTGAIHIFKKEWFWSYKQSIFPFDGEESNNFGRSVSIDDKFIVVGAPDNAVVAVNSGAAYVYERDGDVWKNMTKLVEWDWGGEKKFGYSVGVCDKNIIIGAAYDSPVEPGSGSAYSFILSANGWTNGAKFFPTDAGEEDYFGFSVSISDDAFIVGAYLDDDAGLQSGSAYCYCNTSDLVVKVEDEELKEVIPDSYMLYQNHPNPFNPVTTIVFDLPKPTNVTLKIYTVLGEEVSTLVSEELRAGTHKYIWNPVSLASGVYLYRIESKEFTVTKKMVFLK
ncbi:MAG: T9SS type A sorting domain-containing protein, partial [Ignavibacteriaceae bacterium]|nr:T9SS type A sorting domain-containing protein [Ignavibacteriaceae bacterium]